MYKLKNLLKKYPGDSLILIGSGILSYNISSNDPDGITMGAMLLVLGILMIRKK